MTGLNCPRPAVVTGLNWPGPEVVTGLNWAVPEVMTGRAWSETLLESLAEAPAGSWIRTEADPGMSSSSWSLRSKMTASGKARRLPKMASAMVLAMAKEFMLELVLLRLFISF